MPEWINAARRGRPPARVPSLGGDAHANAGNFRVGADRCRRARGRRSGARRRRHPGIVRPSELDVRTGSIAPTAAQRSDARSLQADVAWNQFGTPSTLVRPGGALGATVDGATATAAARA
jgi:hypothetical protein